MVTLVFVSLNRCNIYMNSFFVVLSAEVNYAHGMWVCCFWQALEVQHDALQKMQLHIHLIDVEVGPLLTFLVSMKAKVHLYQKYVSLLGVYM